MGGGQGRAAVSGVSLGRRRGSHICCDGEIGESLETTDAFAGASHGASAQVSSGLGRLTAQGERARHKQALPSEAEPLGSCSQTGLLPCVLRAQSLRGALQKTGRTSSL